MLTDIVGGMRMRVLWTGLMLLAAAGCSSASGPVVEFSGGGCAYDGPTEFDVSEPVVITFHNRTDATASLLTFRLAGTSSIADITEAAEATPASVLLGGGQMDVPSAQRVDAGARERARFERTMPTGSYAVTCLVEPDDRLVVAARVEVGNGRAMPPESPPDAGTEIRAVPRCDAGASQVAAVPAYRLDEDGAHVEDPSVPPGTRRGNIRITDPAVPSWIAGASALAGTSCIVVDHMEFAGGGKEILNVSFVSVGSLQVTTATSKWQDPYPPPRREWALLPDRPDVLFDAAADGGFVLVKRVSDASGWKEVLAASRHRDEALTLIDLGF